MLPTASHPNVQPPGQTAISDAKELASSAGAHFRPRQLGGLPGKRPGKLPVNLPSGEPCSHGAICHRRGPDQPMHLEPTNQVLHFHRTFFSPDLDLYSLQSCRDVENAFFKTVSCWAVFSLSCNYIKFLSFELKLVKCLVIFLEREKCLKYG